MLRFEYSAGAFVYVLENGKPLFLILKREKDHDIPKGHIEKGETALDAAKREVKEETGLAPLFVPYFAITTKYFFYKGKAKVMKTVKFFIAKSNTKKVKISYEHIGYSWLSYEDAIKTSEYKDIKEAMPKVMAYIERFESMLELDHEYAELPYKTNNWQLSKRLVPGEGPLNASLMIVGQAPGVEEDAQLRPFVGRSGQLLTAMLKKSGIRRESAYVTSVVGFYPPKNREPTPIEIGMCLPFLKRKIEIIKPQFILLLGNVAIKALLGTGNVNRYHGSQIKKDAVTFLITFHPAAALRFNKIRTLFENDLKSFSRIIKQEIN
ncbi:MAG: uracil-DNA glycosylase family protein [Candidatus Micrarchaeaceae archaeon]